MNSIHGIATQFVQFETSAHETRYKFVIEPRTSGMTSTDTATDTQSGD